MLTTFLKYKIGSGDRGSRISPSALSVALVVCSFVWLFGVWRCHATAGSQKDWRGAPILWLLILMLTPAICFALAVVLANARQPARFSRWDTCALLAALFPVTLGSWLAILAVKTWFWASFLEAPLGLRILAVLAALALIPISGAMLWQTTRNYLPGQRANVTR